MIVVDVRADTRQATTFLRAFSGEGATRRATARALNRTVTPVRAVAARLLQQKRNLPIGVIKQSMTINRATSKDLEARIITRGKGLSIRLFSRLSFETAMIGGKREKVGIRGITAKVEKGSRAVLLRRHGNKAFMLPGGIAIVVRKTRKRLPLESWPRVSGFANVVVQDAIAEAMKTEAKTTFPKAFAQEVNYEILLAKKKAGAA